MHQSIFTTGKFEDSSALSHRGATLHLSVCQLHQSIFQQLWSCEASTDALWHCKCTKPSLETCNQFFFFTFSHSDPTHANCPVAKSATLTRRRFASTSRTTMSKAAESRTKNPRALSRLPEWKNCDDDFPSHRSWVRHHAKLHHPPRLRPSTPPRSLTSMMSSMTLNPARRILRKPWTLTKCPIAWLH